MTFKYEQHPLSAAFPSMDERDLVALAADIKVNGQREPGTIFEGMILDGWHRYQACEQAGVEFVATEFTGEDPVAFVKSRNLHRRHLTASQRAASIVMCSKWQSGAGRPGNSAILQNSTTARMAGEAQTSPRTVEDAKRAVEAGLGKDVVDGKISASAAAKKVKQDSPPTSKADGTGTAAEPVGGGAESAPEAPESATTGGALHPVEASGADTDGDPSNDELLEAEAYMAAARDNLALVLLDEDDPLKAVCEENLRLKEQVRALESRIAGLLNEKNALIRSLKARRK